MTLNLAAYHFVAIDDPDTLATQLRERAEADHLLGTVLVAEEGINLFLAGADDVLRAFVDWLRTDPRFADIETKFSHSQDLPFARLKVKRKREIISFRQPDTSPLQAGERAASVSPQDLARWLSQGHDDAGRPVRLVDTRNQQEVEFGSFRDALVLPIDKFVDFPTAMAAEREALSDATLVPFCTGGIRCEKAAIWMQANGFEHVFQLDGGILGYFEKVGGEHYDGRCFVFDERVALDPHLQPLKDAVVAD